MQVRNLDVDVQERLRRRAEQQGLSLSAFLRRELTQLARNLEVRERADALNSRNPLGGPFPGLEHIDIQEVVKIIRDTRGT